MSKRVAVVGLVAAGGVGYYLYTAGGDPKVAQKNFQADAAEAQAKVRSEIPGKEKEYEKKGEAMAVRAGQKLDKTVDEARVKLSEAQTQAREYKDQTGKEMKEAVNNFDKTVERKTSEAKSGISSWFGFK